MAADLPGEFEIIERYFSPLSNREAGAFGLTDDAAVLDCEADQNLVVTTDCLVSGVHFLADDPPDSIAHKAFAVNGSDLAAMGAKPKAYSLALALPTGTNEEWLGEFVRGLSAYLDQFGGALIGGDTVATPGPLTASVTAIGTVGAGQALNRSTAGTDDAIFVSGTIGDGALGLIAARGGLDELPIDDRAHLIDRYRRPTPRLDLGQQLVGLASSAIDISDGLLADLEHVCRCSNVAADIDLGLLPLSNAARTSVSSLGVDLGELISGGDDYELLFTAPLEKATEISELAERLRLPITRIGLTRTQGEGSSIISVTDESGQELPRREDGYRHF